MAGFENISILNPNPHFNVTSVGSSNCSFFTFILCFNILFGPPMHSCILWLIVTGKGIALEFFNFNISVCEIIICVNYFITLVIRFPEVNLYASFTVGFYMTGRPLFQCLICVERYLAVVHPVTFLKYKPLRFKVFWSAFVWFATLCSCFFSLFTVIAHVFVYMCAILLQFFVFFSVNLFCCLAVLWALKKPGPGERGQEREGENHMKRRAFYFILIITLTMIIMFAPAIISMVLYFLLSDVLEYNCYGFLCFTLAGLVQPVLYFHTAGKLNFLCRTLK